FSSPAPTLCKPLAIPRTDPGTPFFIGLDAANRPRGEPSRLPTASPRAIVCSTAGTLSQCSNNLATMSRKPHPASPDVTGVQVTAPCTVETDFLSGECPCPDHRRPDSRRPVGC